MLITVIVCTYNRAALLPRCLESLAVQEVPAGAYEVIVVENACHDGTSAVWERFGRRYPNFRGVREPQVGKSRAVNTGLGHARGTHVAFVDDDSLVPRDWLRKIGRAFGQTDPRPVVVAGKIEHLCERQRPPWWVDLPPGAAGFLTRRSDILSRVAGSNLAFDKQVLLDCGGFSVTHGPVGGRFRFGEDTEAVLRVAARHPYVWYDPSITVQHRVPADKMTFGYLVRRRFLSGMALGQLEGTALLSSRTINALLAPVRRAATGSGPAARRASPHPFMSLRVSLAHFTLRAAEELGRACGARLWP